MKKAVGIRSWQDKCTTRSTGTSTVAVVQNGGGGDGVARESCLGQVEDDTKSFQVLKGDWKSVKSAQSMHIIQISN